MEELVRLIAVSLVDHPESVQVKTVDNPDSTVIELSVGPDDMGKVIGKQGRIAKAIRTVVKAASARSEKPVFVEILE
ncbi:MAG: KH domain-containing protein [Clostridiales bacterium]|nr:KH domain-containing protein [Clostridiales bacterium]